MRSKYLRGQMSRPGRLVEVEMSDGRLVRGVVMKGGDELAQLNVANEAPQHVVLVRYPDVSRFTPLPEGTVRGNWAATNPERPV